MYDTKTIRRHAGLFTTMAERQGIDLQEAVLRAQITPNDITDGVLRCTGCTKPDTCEAEMAQSDRSTAVPDFCRNAALLDALKDTN
ncbi:MAG: DUF6455 family protein [Pseudomonadota bacterium]